MQWLSSADIRQRYLAFFQANGHTQVPSASLIPSNNPTLLFTNAGMVPFVDTFLGLEQRPYSRAVSSQKCLRVSGKHNDLEEVGPSPRHHTFFEMLGNFSFGDYFKAEAIPLAWNLLTKEFALPVERLWFTVFEGNDRVPPDVEAEQLWIKAGAAPDRVLRFGEKDNFWVMGDTGPCGPCSEITMYIGEDLGKMRPDGVNSDDPDYVEIWNNVFMQFDRATMKPLPRPSVDTGMGLERMAMVMQGVHATYDSDLFRPIIERTIALANTDEEHYRAHLTPYRAVADHTRAITFLIADGILPGNEGRSYVLRRILRRAAYQGRLIGLLKPFLAETADVLIAMMGDTYPELRSRRQFILEAITDEEQRFGRTISSGLVKLDTLVQRMAEQHETVLSGEEAFRLKDTDGFPLDLTQKILAERGLTVDEASYEQALDQQRKRSRAATQFKRGAEAEIWAEMELPATEFSGYDSTIDHGQVLAIVAGGDALSTAQEGQAVQIVLDRTPFYAESGGQVGDTGLLIGPGGHLRITDTQRPLPGLIVHYGTVTSGAIGLGERVEARVDAERRRDIMRNHTATHLLHRALRDVLGEHAAQAGSLVAPERLRFDFNQPRPVTPEQQREVERRINAWIRADTPVEWEVTGYQDALARGAMALFGEKYGDRVRMVTVGCADTEGSGIGDRGSGVEDGSPTPDPRSLIPAVMCSRELCGGIHVERTGAIGFFKIIGESGVSSGVRRIEALTGIGAEAWVEAQAASTREIAARLGVAPAQLVERVDSLLAELKQRQRDLDALRAQSTRGALEGLLEHVRRDNNIAYLAARVEAADATRLREMGDWLRDKIGSGVVVLGTVLNDKPQILVVVTPDLVQQGYHAGNLVRALAQVVGGGGGGRPDMAQAGGRDAGKLDMALAEVGALLMAQAAR
jgi:alanyl-tRNA synthetase